MNYKVDVKPGMILEVLEIDQALPADTQRGLTAIYVAPVGSVLRLGNGVSDYYGYSGLCVDKKSLRSFIYLDVRTSKIRELKQEEWTALVKEREAGEIPCSGKIYPVGADPEIF